MPKTENPFKYVARVENTQMFTRNGGPMTAHLNVGVNPSPDRNVMPQRITIGTAGSTYAMTYAQAAQLVEALEQAMDDVPAEVRNDG